jgi:hypothetical protein
MITAMPSVLRVDSKKVAFDDYINFMPIIITNPTHYNTTQHNTTQ